MKIKLVGIQPLTEKDGTAKIGGNVYGIVTDDNIIGLVGQTVFEGYFSKVDLRQFKLGDICAVEYDMRKFNGKWTGYPVNIIKVN